MKIGVDGRRRIEFAGRCTSKEDLVFSELIGNTEDERPVRK